MIKIDTTYYVRTFKRQPKPRDYGFWIFEMGGRGAWTTTSFTGYYRDAVKQARREAQALGCTMIHIAP